MREKYCNNRDLALLAERKHTCSTAWRGIFESRNLAEQGMGVAVGDGKWTSFWTQKWLDGITLVNHVTRAVPEKQINKQVYDYWSPVTGWDWAMLTQFLPSDLLQKIASFELSTEEVGDKPVWIANALGKFNIRSAIQIIQANDSASDSKWKTCWRLQLPQRIRYFLWLILHQRVLSNAERVRRKLLDNPICNICLAPEENLDHLLRKCPNAHNTWQELEVVGMHCTARDAGFENWLYQNISGHHENPEWAERFVITLWFIWKWRCKYCFDSEDTIPLARGQYLMAKFREIQDALHRDVQLRNSSPT